MESVDCVVIGAGVVGLAVARRLALAGREVIVLEAEGGIGRHTSSRNSEVIHAGVYYPSGSLKARLCVTGREALYHYVAERGVPHRRIGKLLIAVHHDEIPTLDRIRRLGEANGVDDLEELSAATIQKLEPTITAVCGVLSPSTGILDAGALLRALRADLEAVGGMVVCEAPVLGGEITQTTVSLDVGGIRAQHVRCNVLVNSAGLHAPRVARALRGLDPRHVPREHYARGHYFLLAGPSPFRHLVYPMPAPGAAGIHVTLDLAGQARFGPDVTWCDRIDYAFDEGKASQFYAAIRRFYPSLADGDLRPGIVGVRPRLVPECAPAADFVIQGRDVHGISGLVNLFGIESPGLTSCLAIADEVATRLA